MPQEDAGNAGEENPVAESISRVRLAPGLQLTQEQIVLLGPGNLRGSRYSCQTGVSLRLQRGRGHAGFGGRRPHAPLVVKLAHPHDLQSEYEAYEEYVRQVSPQNIAHLQGEPLVSEDGQLGLLQYTFAGGESHLPTTSLQTYYESAGAAKTSEVLNRIFRVFGRHWWADNRAQTYVLDEYYDRLLPVHLQAEPAPPGATVDHTIQAGKSSVLVVNEITHGQTIHLIGFQVIESARRRPAHDAAGRAPAQPSSRTAAHSRRIRSAERLLSRRCGRCADRHRHRHAHVAAGRCGRRAAIPGLDPQAQQFTLPPEKDSPAGGVLPNPLVKLPTQLYSVVETKTSIIHGDLNLQNILVDAPTGFAWLIDFAEHASGLPCWICSAWRCRSSPS